MTPTAPFHEASSLRPTASCQRAHTRASLLWRQDQDGRSTRGGGACVHPEAPARSQSAGAAPAPAGWVRPFCLGLAWETHFSSRTEENKHTSFKKFFY